MTQNSLAKLIKKLEQVRSNSSVITITLAAVAGNDIKKKLVAWCRHNISSDVMVSFNFNSGLLGGMVIRFGSQIFDWSFKRQILSASTNFPEVIRRV
jgi:F0F1-type ATP synthase delta subunit